MNDKNSKNGKVMSDSKMDDKENKDIESNIKESFSFSEFLKILLPCLWDPVFEHQIKDEFYTVFEKLVAPVQERLYEQKLSAMPK